MFLAFRMASMKTLVVFDFDWSMIDDNSDTFILEKLSEKLAKEQKELRDTVQWTQLMDQMMTGLHQEGKLQQEITQCLATIPFADAMIEAIRLIVASGAELKIISDANSFFIDAILKAKNIDHHFTEIITNPARWDENGALRVESYHGDHLAPHGCDICPVNLCKGKAIQLFGLSNFERIIYVGDGSADYCPLRLFTERDYVLAREGKVLAKHVRKGMANGNIKMQARFWTEAEDILKIFQDIL
eukprot:TRINITY_DN19233_c0_g1_i1.p1 TRINITY_DN19233_c0_g1~~TRINITY_DN19233_c0_g1_i1.p1  ORF type:complete len:244 (-),score=55.95 TRINITY_DN19233_c0_g1_i1:106-837(-)